MATREVTIKIVGDDEQFRRVVEEVAALKKKLEDAVKIKIKTDNDTNSGGSLFGRIGNLLFGRLGGDGSGLLKKISSLLGSIPKIGGALSGLATSGGLPALAAVAAAVVALIGYVSSILPELVAAGMGVAAFGALAFPTFAHITNAINGTKGAMKGLSPAQKQIVDGAKALKAEWSKMAQTFAPSLIPIMKTLLNIGHKLLPDILPFAQRAAFAINGLLKQFDRFASSPGFKAFMNQMLKLSGPAITAIGQGLGQVGAALGTFIRDLASPNGLLALKWGFTGIAAAIRLIGWALKGAVSMSTTFTSAVITGMQIAVGAVKAFVDQTMSGIGVVFRLLADIPGPTQGFFKSQLRGWQGWQRTVDSGFNAALNKLGEWNTAVQNAPKIVALQANIENLQSNLAVARQQLKDPNLTKTRRAKIEANIDQLLSRIAAARIALASLQNKTLYVTTIFQSRGQGAGPAGYNGVNNAPSNSATTQGWGRRFRGPGQVGSLSAASMSAPAAMPATTVVGGTQININFHGVVTDPTATAKKIQTMLLDLKRTRGGQVLGLA